MRAKAPCSWAMYYCREIMPIMLLIRSIVVPSNLQGRNPKKYKDLLPRRSGGLSASWGEAAIAS